MKITLAIVLAVLICSGLGAAARMQSPQQSTPEAQVPHPGAGDAGPQQQGTPPTLSKPCAESKDTCEVEPAPQQPTTAPVVKPEPQSPQQQSPQVKPPAKPAGHHKKSRHHKTAKKQVPAQDPSGPTKVVVRQGSTSDPTAVLTPGGTARGSYPPQMTAELLSATDANLKEATSKPLTPTQEETINQIKLFMEQANAAMKAGDLDRGHNLATKAHLLSDDLVKH